MDDDEFPVSYQGVTPGVPVLTRDGEQFGILEHVLEVPEEDVFDGIVVWVGHGGAVEWRIQRELSAGHRTMARFLENITRSGDLRFVDADQVAAITAAYIRCDLDRSDIGRLPPPARDAPVYYANAIDQAQTVTNQYATGQYGTMFGRGRWKQRLSRFLRLRASGFGHNTRNVPSTRPPARVHRRPGSRPTDGRFFSGSCSCSSCA